MPEKGYRKKVFNLPKRDVAALLWGAQNIGDERFAFAFDALVLMYVLGLRIGEVVLLQYDHKAVIDAAGMIRSVSVPTLKKSKRRDDAPMPPPPKFDVPVLAHFDLVASAFDHSKRKGRAAISKYLFPSPRDPSQPISARMVHLAFVEAARRGGVTEKATPHCLRHTVATELANYLKDTAGEKDEVVVGAVGRFLRHTKGKVWTGKGSDPFATTRLYIHSADAAKYLNLNDWAPVIRGRAIRLPPLEPGLRAVARGADVLG